MTKVFLSILAFLVLSSPAHAAGWGALLKESCNTYTGKRNYAAKIWTVPLKDGTAKQECLRTPRQVVSTKRRPDKCETRLTGVYGVWYVRDSACGVMPLPRPSPPPGGGYDPQDMYEPGVIPPFTFERLKLAVTPLVYSVARDLGLEDQYNTLLQEMVRLWNENAELQEVRWFIEAVIELQTLIASESEEGRAVRLAISSGELAQTIAALLETDEFKAIAERLKTSKRVRTITITAVGDAQKLLGIELEYGLSIGQITAGGDLAITPNLGTAISVGPSAGADLGVQVGIWTDALDTLRGNTQGFTGAVPIGAYAYNASAFFGYSDKCGLEVRWKDLIGDFKGIVIGWQTPSSKEIEYFRARTWGFNSALRFDGSEVDIGKMPLFEPCVFGPR